MTSLNITEEELLEVKQLAEKTEKIAIELGAIEMQTVTLKSRREEVLKDLEVLNVTRKQYFVSLEEKYGTGNLNTQTGEFELTDQKK